MSLIQQIDIKDDFFVDVKCMLTKENATEMNIGIRQEQKNHAKACITFMKLFHDFKKLRLT